jgi:hypothetical protein
MLLFKKPKINTSFILSNVADLLLTNPTKRNSESDEIGIELEVESESVTNLVSSFEQLKATGCDYWTMKDDGSLRNGKEFVFTKALNRVDATKAIEAFFKVFKENNNALKNSERCSSHMHLNFQHMSMLQVYNFKTLFYMLELPFFNKFAPERIGSSWCTPMFDCPDIAMGYAAAAKEGVYKCATQGSRYTALNVQAIPQHGSLECRMLGESSSKEKPLQWMGVLLELYDYVKANPRLTPTDILMTDDFVSFTRSTFPKTWEALKDLKDIEKLLNFGVYAVQDFAYAVDWTEAKTASAPAKPRKVDPDRVQTSPTLVLQTNWANAIAEAFPNSVVAGYVADNSF